MVQHYLTHSVDKDGYGRSSTHIFALVSWYKPAVLSENLWMDMDFEAGGPHTFVPIQHIHACFIAGLDKRQHNTYLRACAMPRKIW